MAIDSEVSYRLGCLYSFKILLCLTQLDLVQTVMSYLFIAEREREREREGGGGGGGGEGEGERGEGERIRGEVITGRKGKEGGSY